MKNTLYSWLVVIVVAASSWACNAAYATDDKLVSLELKDIDVKSAIESLFRNTGKNFAIEPDVVGTIPSMSIKDVRFDIALKSLTKTANLVYRIDNDIYLISKRPVLAPQTAVENAAVDIVNDDVTEAIAIDVILSAFYADS